MKKLLIAATAVACLSSSISFAKTEGNYAGLSLIRTDMKAQDLTLQDMNFGVVSVPGGKYSNENGFQLKDADQYSVSANYKYAFNFGGFFIAPGAFFDYSNTSTNSEQNFSETSGNLLFGSSQKSSFDLDYRVGVRVDVGYDITDKIAAYAHTGAASNFYNAKSELGAFAIDTSTNTVLLNETNSYSESGNDISLFYGLGFKYSVLDNLDVNLEYEVSKMEMDLQDINQEFDLQAIRLGTSYKF